MSRRTQEPAVMQQGVLMYLHSTLSSSRSLMPRPSGRATRCASFVLRTPRVVGLAQRVPDNLAFLALVVCEVPLSPSPVSGGAVSRCKCTSTEYRNMRSSQQPALLNNLLLPPYHPSSRARQMTLVGWTSGGVSANDWGTGGETDASASGRCGGSRESRAGHFRVASMQFDRECTPLALV